MRAAILVGILVGCTVPPLGGLMATEGAQDRAADAARAPGDAREPAEAATLDTSDVQDASDGAIGEEPDDAAADGPYDDGSAQDGAAGSAEIFCKTDAGAIFWCIGASAFSSFIQWGTGSAYDECGYGAVLYKPCPVGSECTATGGGGLLYQGVCVAP